MIRRQAIRLRRARCLLIYWRSGHLLFQNFASRSKISGAAITCDVLDFFDDWRTPNEAVTHFSNYSPQSIRDSLHDLLQHRLLLRRGSAEAMEDSWIAKEWAPWLPEGAFHFLTKDARYVPSSRTFLRLKSLLPKTPQPKFFKTIKGAKKLPLPPCPFSEGEFLQVLTARRTHRQFSTRKPELEIISQLLSLVWGVRRYLHSPIFGHLPQKTSPSAGARHPGEVYLMALRVEGLKPGLYHYHPVYHRLEDTGVRATPEKAWLYCARQDYVRRASALFLMTAVFPRTMWKYQKARAYRVVLLDAGHLCQTFCLVATWLGLAPFSTAAFHDTLMEKDLGIDGICESMLYVAGIGLPRRNS